MKCPTCGARNSVGLRRCRICAAVLDADAPEDRRGLAKPRHEFGAEAPEDSAPSSPPLDAPGVPESEPAGGPAPESDGGGSAEVFDPDELFRQMDR